MNCFVTGKVGRKSLKHFDNSYRRVAEYFERLEKQGMTTPLPDCKLTDKGVAHLKHIKKLAKDARSIRNI